MFSRYSLSLEFAQEASVATPTRRFCGSMGIILMPLSGYLRASVVIALASIRSLTRGFGKACWGSATRPARSGRLSLESQDSAPMLALRFEISLSLHMLNC